MEIIQHYFEEGYSHAVILDMLIVHHGIKISLRSLKTYLKNAGMLRRQNYSGIIDVRNAIRAELRGPGQLFGYRTMWLALQQKHKLRVKRDDVMRLLQELNPQGTEQRTRRRFVRRSYHSLGPNYLWHVDGYDKLKPFGFAISGCIDGFSRRVLWLICGPTNNDPAVIAHNFITTIQRLGVVPMRLRTDCGTENGTIAAIQCTLRHHHTDHYAGSRSHMYGTSVSNQRIESWWSSFRKLRAQFWIDLFGDLRNEGHFNGSNEHQSLLEFCFQKILQAELDECVALWNKHRIRPSRLAMCPGGVPDELYYLPHRSGSRDCGFGVDEVVLGAFPESRLTSQLCGDKNIQEYLEFVMEHNHLQWPENWEEALQLYFTMKQIAGL